MNVIAKNHDIIIKGEQKQKTSCATGPVKDTTATKTTKVKSLVGSGKVQGALGKAQGVLAALGGVPASDLPSTTPDPTEEGLSTGAKVAIGLGVVAIIGLMVYVSKKK